MSNWLQELAHARTIAVVGLSTNPEKASARVAAYLQRAGFQIVPIHPQAETLLGEKAWRSLAEAKAAGLKIDVVDVFRPPAETVPWAHQAVEVGARMLWLQQGIVNEEAAEIARREGLTVVMDRCLMVDHQHTARQATVQLEQ